MKYNILKEGYTYYLIQKKVAQISYDLHYSFNVYLNRCYACPVGPKFIGTGGRS